jgi:tetratricopeptide (TPR) repeat protein
MNTLRTLPRLLLPLLLSSFFFQGTILASQLSVPPETRMIIDKIYAFDLDGAIADSRQMQQAQPENPLGFLLESEALWWKIWCRSAEFKYGMIDARHRQKLDVDQQFSQSVARVLAIAESRLKQHESAEMHFFAGLAEADTARFYALRAENRNTARAAVRGREHLLRAKALDPNLFDADTGLGLYNYYVDTLSAIARILRFFMGIPGGSKQEGVRLLGQAIAGGTLTSELARFYLALNLHRYDFQYEKALALITPLAERYPSNPVFQIACGDLLAKLGRHSQALESYRAAQAIQVSDPLCGAHLAELIRLAIESLPRH